jgi:hypothetical protein
MLRRVLTDIEIAPMKPAPQASAEPDDPAAKSANQMVAAVKDFVRRALDANNSTLLERFERKIAHLEARLANLERKP